ncbi:hypothetical protein GSQ51_21310, partial [Clostridioides difficile]|nr:hypothetical protein [Clostridioides difficile]
VDMSLEQFGELFENEKIIGVKFTAADFYLLERMRKTFPNKLIAQVGSVNLKEAVELAKFTTDLGYDAISAVTPFYYKFDFE